MHSTSVLLNNSDPHLHYPQCDNQISINVEILQFSPLETFSTRRSWPDSEISSRKSSVFRRAWSCLTQFVGLKLLRVHPFASWSFQKNRTTVTKISDSMYEICKSRDLTRKSPCDCTRKYGYLDRRREIFLVRIPWADISLHGGGMTIFHQFRHLIYCREWASIHRSIVPSPQRPSTQFWSRISRIPIQRLSADIANTLGTSGKNSLNHKSQTQKDRTNRKSKR
jgi:hypothetical protein